MSLQDIERPLNDRGNKDAVKMAKRLKKSKIEPELLLSSPAKRAMDTCIYFAEEFGIKKKKIIEKQELYMADINSFYKVITELDDAYDCVAIFSHNPGITNFANALANTQIDNMPTCSIYGVESTIEKWSDFENSEKIFLLFDYPKKKK